MRLAICILVLITTVAAQAGWPGMRTPGFEYADRFGSWSARADGPVTGSGAPEGLAVEGAAAAFTLPDGAYFNPLAVGTPLLIEDGPNTETVVPLGMSCPSDGQTCSVTAVFTRPHPGRVTIASGTAGLQEAINYTAAHGGGSVLVDAGWHGDMTAILPELHLPSNVVMVDTAAGSWTFYGLGNGGVPKAMGSFSSSTGAAINYRALNGALFANTSDFAPVSPGGALAAGTPTTVTPGWGSVPPGVAAGDTLYVSGGTGAAETVAISNTGTACPNGTAASICFTPAGGHSGAWTLQSATSGLQEAVNAAGPGGWVIDDIPVATLHAPLVLANPVRLTGFSEMDNAVGTQIVQASSNTDTIQIGLPGAEAQDVVLQYLMAVGVKGDGSDTGVAIHCVNCAKLKLDDVTAKNAHDGLYLDSANGAAFDATATGSHFIGNYYGVHLVGGSANRDTFVGNTVDGNVYGVFDDGGWVHTWLGNDIESNTQYGYWQQVSNPAQWSGHNVVLHGNYFERNGTAAGQGDVFLGQLVGGGTGNNGAGCINCEVTDNLFNATGGGAVTAVSFGAVQGTVQNNTFSGYATGKQYAWITGPAPNFSNVLDLGDGTSPGTITRLDPNGTLTLGGSDQLTDQFGTKLHDTTLESPTGKVSVRGVPGGAAAVNGALLALEGNSTSVKSSELKWRNQGVDEWGIKNDVAGANAHDFCLANDYANPVAATCDLYINQQKHFQFSSAGVPGNITFDADYRFRQQANGDPAIQVMRATDSGPSGYLLDLEDSTESHPLFRVDASGNTSINGTLTVQGASVSPAVGAQTGTILSGTYAAGACLTGGVSFASGVATGMAVATNPETAPPAGLVWNVFIDAANHATIRVCNATAGSIAWAGGSVWDVRVIP